MPDLDLIALSHSMTGRLAANDLARLSFYLVNSGPRMQDYYDNPASDPASRVLALLDFCKRRDTVDLLVGQLQQYFPHVLESLPLPNLRGLCFDGADGWAVGDSGAIYRYDGHRWRRIASPTTKNLNSIAFHSGDGWIVGDDGTLLHYDGVLWQPVSPPAGLTQSLYRVRLSAEGDGWAVGHESYKQPNKATILRLLGHDWFVVPLKNPPTELLDICMETETEGWAVGHSLLHYTNGTWQQELPLLNRYRGAQIRKGQVWAVGEGPANMGSVLHFDPDWRKKIVPADDAQIDYLREIQARYEMEIIQSNSGPLNNLTVSAHESWAVGDRGTILHYDSNAWQQVASQTHLNLKSIQMLSLTEGWIVGGSKFLKIGVILRWDGTTWQEYK